MYIGYLKKELGLGEEGVRDMPLCTFGNFKILSMWINYLLKNQTKKPHSNQTPVLWRVAVMQAFFDKRQWLHLKIFQRSYIIGFQ